MNSSHIPADQNGTIRAKSLSLVSSLQEKLLAEKPALMRALETKFARDRDISMHSDRVNELTADLLATADMANALMGDILKYSNQLKAVISKCESLRQEVGQ